MQRIGTHRAPKLSLHLDDPPASYEPGGRIHGTVVASDLLDFKGALITVTLPGRAEVSITWWDYDRTEQEAACDIFKLEHTVSAAPEDYGSSTAPPNGDEAGPKSDHGLFLSSSRSNLMRTRCLSRARAALWKIRLYLKISSLTHCLRASSTTKDTMTCRRQRRPVLSIPSAPAFTFRASD